MNPKNRNPQSSFRGPQSPPPAASPTEKKTAPPSGHVRQFIDELVFIFVFVMFLKMFVAELYKIPTGSMTPTLLGTMGSLVASIDLDGDDHKDMVYLDHGGRLRVQVFMNRDGRYVFTRDHLPGDEQIQAWLKQKRFKKRSDRILVNKVAYWFHPPRRGDIVIFKVPDPPFRPEAPIYIKRLVGEPGDLLTFDPTGRLIANGDLLSDPSFFRTQHYDQEVDSDNPSFVHNDNVVYRARDGERVWLESIRVGPDEAYVFGDNTYGSLDSRFWGPVPIAHFKGRAFLRLWPLRNMKFLD